MSCILNIETATNLCSVAVSQDGAVIFQQEEDAPSAQAAHLAGMVGEAVSFADSHAIPLDAVAISSGPGSYTGLRIGTSLAKGLCYGQNLKLIAVPTLELLCVPVLLRYDELPDDALLCPMIDARRMEVYCALYNRALKPISPTEAKVIDSESFATLLDEHPIYFFGNGAEKCKSVITHPAAHFIDGIRPQAKYMQPLAERAHAREDFVDVAYFEPYYLKDFVATVSKKNLLS